MGFMKKKKIFIILIAVVIAFIISSILFYITKAKKQEEKKMAANDWFLEQTDYLNNILNFMDSVDTVYCLYLSGSMSKTDFLNYNKLLQQQYDIMDNEYEQYKKENPVRMGTQSFISQSGIDSIENIRKEIRMCLNDMIAGNEPLDYYDMIYTYLAHNENLNNYFCEFTVCFRWLLETDTFEQDYETLLTAWNARMEKIQSEE